jgi:hypothetical protein
MLQTRNKSFFNDISEDAIATIVNHVARYRLSVFNAIERLPCFIEVGAKRVKDILAECRSRSLLESAPLHHGAKYWYLGQSCTEQHKMSPERIGPLSEPAKLRALAILRFCCLSDRPRHRLLADELRASFPDVARPGLSDGYYFDSQGSGRIGLIRVDAGRRGRWDRVIQSLREDVDNHVHCPGFRKLIQAGRFEITVLTVFRQKAQRISDSLAQHPDTRRTALQVVAMPELLPLLSCRC